MTKVAITGAGGRMGGALIQLLASHDALQLTQALEHDAHADLGGDSGVIAGGAANGVAIAARPDAAAFDMLIDFSRPDASMQSLEFCAANNKGMVIGTTGMDDAQQQQVAEAAKKIPIVFAANTSVGVNLCASLVATAAKALGPIYDVEVVESHHKHKVDAPSGTALMLGRAAAEARGVDLSAAGVFARHGNTGARAAGAIGFATIRGGDIAGEHTVLFIGESERIEITHRATDRIIFARGALRAAEWIGDKLRAGESGLFSMQQVLGLARN